MVSTASTNALPMNCPWRNKLSPSPRPRRGVHIVKVCPVDNIYLLCYTATCLSSIAGAGYSSPFPSHQGVHTRWFGRALEWHSRGKGFDPPHLHHKKACRTNVLQAFFFSNVHTFVHTLNFIRQTRHRKVRPGNGTARRKSTFHECQSFGAYNAQRLS